jgi:hypothetical protein
MKWDQTVNLLHGRGPRCRTDRVVVRASGGCSLVRVRSRLALALTVGCRPYPPSRPSTVPATAEWVSDGCRWSRPRGEGTWVARNVLNAEIAEIGEPCEGASGDPCCRAGRVAAVAKLQLQRVAGPTGRLRGAARLTTTRTQSFREVRVVASLAAPLARARAPPARPPSRSMSVIPVSPVYVSLRSPRSLR